MTETSSNSSFKTVVITLLIAIVGFVAFMAYSLDTSIKNKARLDGIKNMDFPVLERVDANIVRLDKIKELFLQALMSAEEDLVEDTQPIKEATLVAFNEIKSVNSASNKQVDKLIEEFEQYYDLGANTTLFLMDQMDDVDVVKDKTEAMNASLSSLQKRIFEFRAFSYNNFSDTLAESNQSALRNMYMGIAVGVMNLFFMAVLVYFIKNNHTMMAVIAEQNATLEHRVNKRTAQLAQKTNDMNSMLNNMTLGVFTVVEGQKIHPEYSAYLETILGGNNIAGASLSDCLLDRCELGSNTKDQIFASLDSIIGEDSMSFGFNSHLLVNEMELVGSDGNKKILSLGWNPIVTPEDTIDKVLVIVQDVTELKRLELEAGEQRKELAIISQILKISVAKYNEFISSALAFIDENELLIHETMQKESEVINLLFRNMHTIKGNARTYEFSNLTDVIHNVEQVYDQLRKDKEYAWDQAALLHDLETAKKAIAMYQHVNDDVLGRKGRASDLLTTRGCFVSNEEIDNLRRQVGALSEPDALMGLQACIMKIGQIPLTRLVDGSVDSIASLSKELGKATPLVKVIDRSVSFENQLCEPLKSSFMHIVRNSIDHGIETSEERLKVGKPEAGTIYFEVVDKTDHIELNISDDGRGLALHKIYQKALSNGFYTEASKPTSKEVAQLVFNSGLSTADNVTQVSGRGVGLDAAKSFLAKQGVTIAIALESLQEELTFTPFKFVITIPKGLYSI